MIIALDTETTGIDFYHGALPFFVTSCDENGEQQYWEWYVNPLTRKPVVPKSDLYAIQALIDAADELVLQNGKFDVAALRELFKTKRVPFNWPRHKTHDTLRAGHLLGTNLRHDLTSMVLQYLGRNIEPLELDLKKVCNDARRIARKLFPDMRIAKEGEEDMPSAKGGSDREERGAESEKPWKFDSWLPRVLARELNYPADHPWWHVLREYSNADSASTLALWQVMRPEIERQNLWPIYQTAMRAHPIAYNMERRGITLSRERLDRLSADYEKRSDEAGATCVNIAAELNYDLNLPKGGNNASLRDFCFGPLDLPQLKWSEKTGEPSLDKFVMDQYETLLPQEGLQLRFIQALKARRKSGTAVTYMQGYKRYWLPMGILNRRGEQLWYRLHPSLNPTGTDHLRWSSSNPNEQNISKQEGFNLRYCFGPAPDREWWSLDAQNIELRIPSFEAGEEELMEVFLNPKKPPYFGSYHLVVFDALHPELFAKHGKDCKTLFESTWYQWVKNGNFAVIYGAQEKKADETYHVPGAFKRLRSRFPKIAELSNRWIAFAEKRGYVETIPDKSIGCERGYPILCSRTEYGRVMPTVPLNYHVSGTAMWWTIKAMTRVHEQLEEWREWRDFDGFIAMQVHDELVLDLPKRGDPVVESKGQATAGSSNLQRVRQVQKLMEMGGADINVPTPVGVKYHCDNWSEGIAV